MSTSDSFDGEAQTASFSPVIFVEWVGNSLAKHRVNAHRSLLANSINKESRSTVFELENNLCPKKDYLDGDYLTNTCTSITFI